MRALWRWIVVNKKRIHLIILIDLHTACIGLALFLWREPRRVVYIMTKDFLAIFTVLAGKEYMLMPEFIHLLHGRGDNVILAFMRQSIEKALIFNFHAQCFFRHPAQLLYQGGAHQCQVKIADMLF